jgi:serine/threonine protein kinase
VIGKKLGGRYEVLDRVGGGGMAVVYKAKDILLDRIIAVKILRPQYAIDDDFVHRFRREAQAAASLSHPNIVSIYDVGVEEEDTHYIVMEYVEGTTLKEYINQFAPLQIDETVQIAKQIAEALEHAHHNQIIHRDIKPHNILVGKNQRIKVTDFGIARAVTSSTITHTGSVLGSVHYFSPEQARGGITGQKSDIYSLGIVIYEMCTAKLPFSGDSPISVALKHLQESYTEPRELNPRIPQSLENIIFKSLAKDPINRYHTAKELYKDLETCLLSERSGEEKQIIDHHDDEATKIVPAIREDMYDTKIKIKQKQTEDDEEWEDDEEAKGSIWKKIIISLIIILLLGVGSYQGYAFVSKLLYVEDIVLEDVTNLPVEEAISILEAQGFRVDATRELNSDEVEAGHVINQVPQAGQPVKENKYVRLTVSLGKDQEKMNSFISLSEQTSLRLLKNSGFLEENIEIIRENHPDIKEGFVIRQEPNVNASVIPDETKVMLVISKGKEKFAMPSLIGEQLEVAESILERHDLILEKVVEDFGEVPEGQVYRQHPIDPGQPVEAGTPIRIWVSKGYKETFREKSEEVIVFINADEEATIAIFVTDMNGTDRRVLQEKLTESKRYKITLKVERDKVGVIKIFKDAELYDRTEVPF